MRLLLDETLSPMIAEGLRSNGHDAVALVERPELRGLSDDELLATAHTMRRVLVTRDVAHFASLAAHFRASDRAHHGVVLVPPRRFSAAAKGIGALVRALGALCRDRRQDGDLVNAVLWFAPS